MKKLIFKEITFVKSCAKVKNCPQLKDDEGEPKPQVAVAGRSNVGKSTLLNHLFKSKNLVKTSSKPGKTRLLNFFEVDKTAVFCDLPGYGYANVKIETRSLWKDMIEPYIEKTEDLKVVLLLLDARRKPSVQDIQFFEWVQFHKKPLLLVLTKVDKLSRSELKRQVDKILLDLGQPDIPFVKYSATKNVGRRELIFELNEALE